MYCTYCNFKNESESKYCGSCGKPLKEARLKHIPTATNKPTSTQNATKKKTVAGVFIILVVAAVVVVSTLPLFSKKEIVGWWNCRRNALANLDPQETALCERLMLEFFEDGVFLIHEEGKPTLTGHYVFTSNETVELSSNSRFFNGVFDLTFWTNNDLFLIERGKFAYGASTFDRANPKFNFSDLLGL